MPATLTTSDCLSLLANRRRRLTVQVLRESDGGPLSIDEVAARIAEREYENPSPEERRDIRIALHHNHLPRLEEADVISEHLADDAITLRRNVDALSHVAAQVDDGNSLRTGV